MTLNGELTFTFSENGASILLRDTDSRVNIIQIELTPEQVCHLFSNTMEMNCIYTAQNLEKIGKVKMNESFEFYWEGSLANWEVYNMDYVKKYIQEKINVEKGGYWEPVLSTINHVVHTENGNIYKCQIVSWA